MPFLYISKIQKIFLIGPFRLFQHMINYEDNGRYPHKYCWKERKRIWILGLQVCKTTEKVKDEVIPVVCGVTGGILGVAGMYLIPEFPAGDVINAAAIGIVSGLASTGVHQVIKQVGKK